MCGVVWLVFYFLTVNASLAETIYPTAAELGIAQFETVEFRTEEFLAAFPNLKKRGTAYRDDFFILNED